MKKILFFIFTIIIYNLSYSQTEKGKFTVGSMSVNYNIYNMIKQHTIIDTSKQTDVFEKYGGWGVHMHLQGSYFVKNNLCIGLQMGKTKSEGISVTFQPFLRYYFNKKSAFNSQKIIPYIESAFDFSIIGNDGLGNKLPDDGYYRIGNSIGPGISFFVSKRIAIETLMLSHIYYYRSKSYDFLGNKNLRKDTRIGFNVYLGFSYFF